MNFIGKPIHIDYTESLVTFEMAFVDEEVYNQIEKHIAQDKFIRLTSHSLRKYNHISHNQLKYWFVIVNKILKYYDIPVNTENTMSLHYELKKAYFPVGYITMGTRKIPQIPSINSISKEDMIQIIDRIVTDYELVGVNFNYDF